MVCPRELVDEPVRAEVKRMEFKRYLRRCLLRGEFDFTTGRTERFTPGVLDIEKRDENHVADQKHGSGEGRQSQVVGVYPSAQHCS